jgi:hypothetical protein
VFWASLIVRGSGDSDEALLLATRRFPPSGRPKRR